MPKNDNHAVFNFTVGILNGAFFMFGASFMSQLTVIPVFIKNFTDSNLIVGFVSSLHRMGWHLPQLLVANYVERFAFKKFIYVIGNLFRIGLLALAIPLMARFSNSFPSLVLVSFIVLYGLGHLCGGVAGLPFVDMVGKTIPARGRGMFYAIRFFFGAGVFGTLAGIIVKHILSDAGRPFPTNYVLIFTLSAVGMSVGILCYTFVKEPPSVVNGERKSWAASLREVPNILREDTNYRTMLLGRLLMAGGALAMPFYVVFAREDFHVEESAIGLFLAVQNIGAALSNLLWGYLSFKKGNRFVIRVTAVLQVLAPLYAAASAEILPMFGVTSRYAFVPIFLITGGTIYGGFIGYISYLLDVAPVDRRPTYIGIMNTAMGFASLLPTVGGMIATAIGFKGLFLVAAFLAFLGAVVTMKLEEVAR